MNNVSVLEGTFLARLRKRQLRDDRLREEEFLAEIEASDMGEFGKEWRLRVEAAKEKLLVQLDYSGCNAWLEDSAYFAEQCIVDSKRRIAACRALYLVLAFFLIGVDFVLKDLAFLDNETKSKALREGFAHGSLGKEGIDRILETSMALVRNYLPDGDNLAVALRRGVLAEFEQVPGDILKEFFMRVDVLRSIFKQARLFEDLAFSRSFVSPVELDYSLQAVIGVVLDFNQIERRLFFDSFKDTGSTEATHVTTEPLPDEQSHTPVVEKNEEPSGNDISNARTIDEIYEEEPVTKKRTEGGGTE